MDIFERRESEVRGYCRSFPALFSRAQGPFLYSANGDRYIDFFSGAGGLNYGHNHPELVAALIQYLENDGVLHSLDMATQAKKTFLENFERIILEPRNLDYRIQFPGPTGTNAVEAALKLARKVKKRRGIVAFTNGYHGLTGNSLAATGNRSYRNTHYLQRSDVSFMPFDGYHGAGIDSAKLFANYLADASSGLDIPAAVILETVQAEGGVNVASDHWLRQISQICKDYDILLIVDDIQAGCGRTGTFFSFEPSGIVPDMVTLSKSISGLGLPMSLLLLNPACDQWHPGEHTGTFRGNNLAFIAASHALSFWEDETFKQDIQELSEFLGDKLQALSKHASQSLGLKGRGLIRGLEASDPDWAGLVSKRAFEKGLIVETCGAAGQVLKLLPALNISEAVLEEGLAILKECM